MNREWSELNRKMQLDLEKGDLFRGHRNPAHAAKKAFR